MRRIEGIFRFHPNRMLAALGAAAAAVMCAWIVALIWVLNLSSERVDVTRHEGERRLLSSVLETYRRTLSKGVTDYAWWDELYNYFQGPRDKAWEQDNLGPYISEHFDIDYVCVTGRNGTVLYFYAKGKPAAALSEQDRRLLARLSVLASRSSKHRNEMATSGIVEFGGGPGLLGVSAIHIPQKNKNKLPERVHLNLIEIRALTPEFLSRIGTGYGIKSPVIRKTAAAGLALADPFSRRSAFRLTWQPAKSGHDLFLRVLPTIVFIGFASLASFLALMLLGVRVVQHLRSSESRVLSAELAASQARAQAAEETSRSKSMFIANMSHELRTPLNAIIGFSDFIGLETLGPIGNAKYRDYIRDIHGSGQHLLRIVNDILQVSRIEAGKFEPDFADVSLNDVLGDSARMLEVIAERRGIALQLSLPDSEAIVRTDSQALRQILINVISNAVKFSFDGGCVEIACKPRESRGFEVTVADHGCGIPAETLREIGKPFVQAEGAFRRNYQGTGLGLAISFLLARAIGAAIEIASAEGEGTTVRVMLAADPGASAAPAPRLVQAA